jgi:hypothetical protein
MHQRLLPVLTFSLIALSLLFVPLKRAHADSGYAGLHTTVDGYTVELVFPNGQPNVGPNHALVRILDAGGQPVSGVTVQVAPVALNTTGAAGHSQRASGQADASTGGHNDTHADNAIAQHADAAANNRGHTPDDEHIDTIMTQMEAGADAGSYTSVIHFDSAGAWEVQLQFTNAGVNHVARFTVPVAEPARDWRILGAFGGANALIIVTAGVLKRRLLASGKTLRRATAAGAEN